MSSCKRIGRAQEGVWAGDACRFGHPQCFGEAIGVDSEAELCWEQQVSREGQREWSLEEGHSGCKGHPERVDQNLEEKGFLWEGLSWYLTECVCMCV